MQLPAASSSSARTSGQSNAVTGPALRLNECEIERGPSVLFLRATIYARTHILHGHCALFPSRLCSRNHRSFPIISRIFMSPRSAQRLRRTARAEDRTMQAVGNALALASRDFRRRIVPDLILRQKESAAEISAEWAAVSRRNAVVF